MNKEWEVSEAYKTGDKIEMSEEMIEEEKRRQAEQAKRIFSNRCKIIGGMLLIIAPIPATAAYMGDMTWRNAIALIVCLGCLMIGGATFISGVSDATRR